MANNRLYIVDDEQKVYCMLAKSNGTGWFINETDDVIFADKIERFLEGSEDGFSSDTHWNTKLRLTTEAEDLSEYEMIEPCSPLLRSQG